MKLGETLERWLGKAWPSKRGGMGSSSTGAPEWGKICDELGVDISPECLELLVSHGLSQEDIIEFVRATNTLDCGGITDLDHEIDRMYAIKVLNKHGFASLEHYTAELNSFKARH